MGLQANLTTNQGLVLTSSFTRVTNFRWNGGNPSSPLKVQVQTCVWNTEADHDASKAKIESRGYEMDYDLTSSVDLVEQAEDWIIANDPDYASATKV